MVYLKLVCYRPTIVNIDQISIRKFILKKEPRILITLPNQLPPIVEATLVTARVKTQPFITITIITYIIFTSIILEKYIIKYFYHIYQLPYLLKFIRIPG